MRLAGAMTIHQGVQAQFAEQIISDLARHVDALFILVNGEPPREVMCNVQLCPKLAEVARVDIPYNAANAIAVGHELHARLFALMDKARPEMVLFPDADELLPPNIEEIIALMDRGGAENAEDGVPDNAKAAVLSDLRASAVKKPALCVEFPVLVCVGDGDHVIRDASIHAKYHRPQVTLAVWRPGMKFDAKRGFNYPGEDYVGRGIVSPWPKRHLYVATPAAWRARYTFKPQPWMVQPWNVVEYDPKRTWEEWECMGRMRTA
ncbi:MAG: hypothetical protein ABSA67_14230 [Candidatus Brocadiia bacterium]|jgi:hypothetical protein